MCRKIVITSGKGGVGKTTIVSGLGVTLARMGYKTLLIDMDFGLNNLDVLMGIENKIVYDIIDLIEGKCTINQVLIQDFFESNLFILPSTHGFCKVKFSSNDLEKIIYSVENKFDFILIDCPAGIDGGFKRAIFCATEYIVVTTPHLSAIRDADKVLNILNSFVDKKPYLIINRARGDMILDGDMLKIETICNCLNCNLLGVLTDDDNFSKQLLKGGIFDISNDIDLSLKMISNKLLGLSNDVFDCTQKYKGFLGKIRKKIRKKL